MGMIQIVLLTLFLWALIDAYRTVPRKPATARGCQRIEETLIVWNKHSDYLTWHLQSEYRATTYLIWDFISVYCASTSSQWKFKWPLIDWPINGKGCTRDTNLKYLFIFQFLKTCISSLILLISCDHKSIDVL